MVALCAVAREHLLVVGAPGTAKSEAVRRVARALGGSYFEYLLGRFTEPHEIFGPVDLRRLREGVVEVETAGMLPEAEIAFLDEVFLGSTAILNTLLGILNERTFRHGRTLLEVPLRVCVGAANTLPEEPALAAFADRFLARVFVEPVPTAGWRSCWSAARGPAIVGREPRDDGGAGPAGGGGGPCGLADVRPALGAAVRRLRAAGVGDLRPPRRTGPAADRRGRRAGRPDGGDGGGPVGPAADRADARRPGRGPRRAGGPGGEGGERESDVRGGGVLAQCGGPGAAAGRQSASACWPSTARRWRTATCGCASRRRCARSTPASPPATWPSRWPGCGLGLVDAVRAAQ